MHDAVAARHKNRAVWMAFLIATMVSVMHCSEAGNSSPQDLQIRQPTRLPAAVGQNQPDAFPSIAESRHNAITTAVAKVSPAVVGINVTQIRRVIQRSPFDNDPFWGMFFPPQEYQQKVKGLGSGFFISSDGYVLTNEHVVENASEIIVTTTDGKQVQADLVGKDMAFDVALLKIKGNGFPFIPFGDSDDVLPGEWAIALGNPFGLFDVNSKPTVTVGVISATNLDFQGSLQIEGRLYNGMIQTDAAINGGNSGGPLVNGLGQCIGINAFIISGSQIEKTSIGIGFAIPINRVKKILPELKATGRVNRPFNVGFRFRNMTASEARGRGISMEDGVLITQVTPGSSAERAGLRAGDVVVAVDGDPLHTESELRDSLSSLQATQASRIALTVFRRGRLYEAGISLR